MSALALLLASAPALARSLGAGGGAPDYSAAAAAAAAATAAAQQGSAAAQRSIESLARATEALQGLQAAQAAARAAAGAGGVPNGLAAGGLVPDSGLAAAGVANPVLTWTSARSPVQSGPAEAPTVTVQQTGAQAILNWSSFNVGANTSLVFDQQGNSNWVALNRVVGAASPSQILGRIQADGQIYVINQNGIIFGGASQINVGSLIASTAALTDAQFNASGIYSSLSGLTYVPSFSGATEAVTVEQGAEITTHAPGAVTRGGGFVMLLGASVDNAGSITTPKGQTVLAAGRDFVVRKGYATDANSFSTTRGSEVAPGLWNAATSTWSAGGGTVTNSGLLFAQQGDITLAGHAVAQNGVAIATTSVDVRGSIHLLNSASDASGSVTLGAASLTQIMPELETADTALNSKRDALIADSATQNAARAAASFGQFDNLSLLADRQDLGRVEIVSGGVVKFDGGSLTLAQGGQIAVSAGSRVFTAQGAVLDVSGTSSALPMSANSLKINVQPNEMRDAPINRDSGVLTNKDVWIDARDLVLVPAGTGGYATDRYYTKGGLLEVSGYLANTGHTIGEWTSVGGIITLSAAEIVAQAGSLFNLSGGTINYQAGQVLTSNVMGADGRLYSIGSVPAGMPIIALGQNFTVDHARWGVEEVWTSPTHGAVTSRWDEGYTVGRDAGQLILSAPTAVFEASIVAEVLTGTRRTEARPSGVTDGYKLTQNTVPLAGALAIGQYGAIGRTGAAASGVIIGDIADITSGLGAEAALPSDRANTAWFDAGILNQAGLGGVSIASSKSISVTADLTLARGGNLELVAPTIDIAATLTARGGSVTLTNLLNRAYLNGASIANNTLALAAVVGRAGVTLRPDAVIDTRGVWTNALLDPLGNSSGQAFADGGAVTLRSSGDITLGTGSTIDASAGAALLASGKLKGGSGGNISLIAAYDLVTGIASSGPGRLTFLGDVRSFGVAKGGALTLETGGTFTIGDTADALPVSLFQSGFSAYTLNGGSGLTLAPGAAIEAVMPVYRLSQSGSRLPTGSEPAAALELWTPPLYLENPAKAALTQRAGTTVTLQAGAPTATLLIGAGSSVTADPGASITLSSMGQITVDGRLTAHGGEIAVLSTRWQPNTDPGGLSVWIGSQAVLDVSAQAHTAMDAGGRIYGVVPDGGNVVLGGRGGKDPLEGRENALLYTDAFVVLRPGSVIDVSGTRASLDFIGLDGRSVGVREVASNGGSIALRSGFGIYNNATLVGRGGGAGAAGGTLLIELESPTYDNTANAMPALFNGRKLVISQAAPALVLPSDLVSGVASSALAPGYASLGADQVAFGGFDHLSLFARTAIVFDGDVSLSTGGSIMLRTAEIYNAVDRGHAVVSAPYVRLDGQYIVPSIYLTTGKKALASVLPAYPTTGTLRVEAGLIDVVDRMNVKLADTTLASRSDLRFLAFDGKTVSGVGSTTVLAATGNLALYAGAIYPATGAVVEIRTGAALSDASGSAFVSATGGYYQYRTNSTGTLTVGYAEGATTHLPHSVFGSISLFSGSIVQGGALLAPMGSIALISGGASASSSVRFLPGSVTSVSAGGLVIPYGGTVDGALYTVDGTDPAFYGLLTGQKITYNTTSAQYETSNSGYPLGITVSSVTVTAEAGALLDVSGGGTLTGAAFIAGRGGSVDALLNPVTPGGQVYAILPGIVTAPATPSYYTDWTGSLPEVGQQITIPDGVPGLPAGTYTLLPANYALLPGAFRVELGARSTTTRDGATALPNGSYLVGGQQSIAGTAIVDSRVTAVTVTPGAVVRTWSQYNEQSYDTFQRDRAATFGTVRPFLAADGKFLDFLLYTLPAGSVARNEMALTFEGEARFAGAAGGYDGYLVVGPDPQTANVDLTITGPGSATQRTTSRLTISGDTIARIGAPNLFIGGTPTYVDYATSSDIRVSLGVNTTLAARTLTLEGGVALTGSQIILAADSGGITLQSGASIDTLGRGVAAPDSTTGYFYTGSSLLAASNGLIALSSTQNTTNKIWLNDGSSVFAEGSIGFTSGQGVVFGRTARFGARDLELAMESINIGSPQAIADAAAAGVLPAGLVLDQALLDRLLVGDPLTGAPATKNLILSASKSINFYGSTTLTTIDPATGRSALEQFVFSAPAIYGSGTASDGVSIVTDTFVWSGRSTIGSWTNGVPNYVSLDPGSVVAGGPGTGTGTFDVRAREIVFGYMEPAQPNPALVFNRLMLGFDAVSFTASEAITANNRGTLSVYRQETSRPTGAFDPVAYAAGGYLGALKLITPLLTGAPGSSMSYWSGANLTVASPAGVAPSNATESSLGAAIALHSKSSIDVSTAIVLNSGRLEVDAAYGTVELRDGARLDLTGVTIPFTDTTRSSWGGDIRISAGIAINLFGGAVLDVSAENDDAGSITLAAADAVAGPGGVYFLDGRGGFLDSLDGILRGSGGDGHAGGAFAVSTYYLGDGVGRDHTAAFATLNAALDAGGFTTSRSFALKQGDLTVGGRVRAQEVVISVDGGSLTVGGTIDASGAGPGSIRLAAKYDLTLAGSAVLDAHGTVLQTDSDGDPVEASNRGHVTLTSRAGRLVLGGGATLDLTAPDGVSRGVVELNARRLGSTGASATGAGGPSSATGSDIAIDAAGPLAIRGAGTIALNGVQVYTNAPFRSGSTDTQEITQGFLDLVDSDSRAFVDGALANGALAARIAGLTAYAGAFHLRPGVEIASQASGGNLVVTGDIDLAGYRYGPNADRNPASPGYGAGEVGTFALRAAGNLTVNGSISDGFGAPVSVQIGSLTATETLQVPRTLTVAIALASASIPMAQLTTTPTLNFDAVLGTSNSVNRGIAIPFAFTSGSNVIQTGWTATANIYSSSGALLYASGAVVTAAVPAGSLFAAGTTLPWANATAAGRLTLAAGTVIPAGTAIRTYINQTTSLFLGAQTLAAGATLPAQTTMTATTPVVGKTTPMLAAGSQSWSIRLAAGADLGSADGRGLRSVQELNHAGIGATGNMLLSDLRTNPVASLPEISVIRTGTGDLELLAGGGISQQSPFGIYTAGTQIGADSFAVAGGAITGYYTDHGGDLLVRTGGDLTGYIFQRNPTQTGADNFAVSRWLLRGGDQSTGAAWAINFGAYVSGEANGFSGYGTLGGGNLAVRVGGNAGALAPISQYDGTTSKSTGLVFAVASTGRVTGVAKTPEGRVTGGTLVETGGGDLSVTIDGRLNPITLANRLASDDIYGSFTNARGDIRVDAATIGSLPLRYGRSETTDPRGVEPYVASLLNGWGTGGPVVVLGDGAAALRTRGDLVLGGVGDPGMAVSLATATASYFSLWRQDTAIDLVSLGGNIAPLSLGSATRSANESWTSASSATNLSMLPPQFSAVAASGSLYLGGVYMVELAPSPQGYLELLAADSIFGQSVVDYTGKTLAAARWAVSGAEASPNAVPNPFKPSTAPSYFTFQPDTVTSNLHAGDDRYILVEARSGDVLNLAIGAVATVYNSTTGNYDIRYQGGMPVRVRAGRDIVNFGRVGYSDQYNKVFPGLIVGADPTDVSIVAAGRNILYLNVQIAGPGSLDVSAGGTVYQGNLGAITSIGPLASGDTRPGASIVVAAGLGSDGADYAALTKYLDAANLAVAGTPLADQPGKVAKTYEAELIAWLFDYYGYEAQGAADARAVFSAKPAEQQAIFLRQVYFAELKAGGREYNDPSSSRYGSYLRGRQAIAALFPEDRSYAGDLIMFGGSGIRTLYGGDISILTPGGRQVLGVEGTVPPASSGVITQGAGDIGLYSKGSILLGLSRIMTTFGGDILAWSAEGDINAGRGSKTTQVYTPPKRIYDAYGNVTLSPAAPATGAGIATLNPVPGTPAGDVDLIAPLGTIDAGEAGIRVSGDVNLAARQIVNAANIQVQGTTTGLPTVQAPPTAALTAASNVAGAATPTAAGPAQDNDRPSIILVEFLGFGGGDGESPSNPERQKRSEAPRSYDRASAVQVIGHGELTDQEKQYLSEAEKRGL